MDDPTLEEIHASPSPSVKTLGPSSEAPSLDFTQLQKEANQALGHLLATRSSYQCLLEETSFRLWDGSSSKCVWDHWGHQGSEGPLCPHHLGHRDPLDSTNKQSQSPACCPYQGDWGQLCLHLRRGRELLFNSHQGDRVLRCFPSPLNSTITHQRHPTSRGRGHWGGEKGQPCIPHCLQYCPQGSPPKAHGIMVASFHLLLGNAPTSTLLSIPPGISPPEQEPSPQTLPSSAPAVTGPLPWWHNSPNWVQPPSPSETTSKVTPKVPPHSKQKEEMLFHKALSRSHQDTFSRDSRLVQKVREDYYWENCLHFNSETSCNMADIFWNMIISASPLCSKIYEIQKTCTGQHELQYANYALKLCQKGWNSSTQCSSQSPIRSWAWPASIIPTPSVISTG